MKNIRLNGIIAAVVLAVMMLLSAQSQAGYYSGSTLLQGCESDTAVEYGACVGYIVGIIDSHDTMVEVFEVPMFCQPENANSTQLVKVVTKYLNEHPEDLHYSASGEVYGALMEAFPCS